MTDKITFTGNNVLSNELSNKTGNLSETIFNHNMQAMGKPKVDSLGSKLSETNPYVWNSNSDLGKQGFDNQLPAYLEQARMSSYYQDNPFATLTFSKQYGIEEPLGGLVRPDLPPGSFPGNVLSKPGGRMANMYGSKLYAPGQQGGVPSTMSQQVKNRF